MNLYIRFFGLSQRITIKYCCNSLWGQFKVTSTCKSKQKFGSDFINLDQSNLVSQWCDAKFAHFYLPTTVPHQSLKK